MQRTDLRDEIVLTALRVEAAQARSDTHEMGHAMLDLIALARSLRKLNQRAQAEHSADDLTARIVYDDGTEKKP